MNAPRILILDIETSLMEFYGFGIRNQYISAEMIKKDWTVISVAAKWLDDKEIFQIDTEHVCERRLLTRVRALMNKADIIIGHNSKNFDIKRLNGKFEEHGIKRPSSFQQVDTYRLSTKHFSFSSHTLDYLLKKLNAPIRKLKHAKFPGKTLWIECDKGNPEAFEEMRKYNVRDVLGTEWLYKRLAPWGTESILMYFMGMEMRTAAVVLLNFITTGIIIVQQVHINAMRVRNVIMNYLRDKILMATLKRS